MSDLRSRLAALQRQSGVSSPDEAVGAPPQEGIVVRQRLQRLGSGRRRRSPRRGRITDPALAAGLGGQMAGDGVIRICERLSADTMHGEFPLVESTLHQALSLCGGAGGDPSRPCIFMDTETTGLAGGTGTLVFLLGMARFCEGALEVCQLVLTGFQGETAMLREAGNYLDDAHALVTFNGRSFDGPLLAARYRLAGMQDPFAELRHVDLLHPTRRTFKHRWPDCRLQTAERRLLGFERVGDLPGCEAPQAWFDWVRHGRHEALAAVCAHNRLDLLSLAVLPAALQRSHDDPAANGANLLACARHHGQIHGGLSAFDYLRRHRAVLDDDALLELARLARQRGEAKLAVEIWEQLARNGSARAIEHLAKHYEHVERDYRRALEVTARLLACAPHDRHHQRRHARLRARLAENRC